MSSQEPRQRRLSSDATVAVDGKDATTKLEATATNDTTIVNSKPVLTEASGLAYTAYSWPQRKKWWILTVVALCQTSMNFNAAVYSNAVGRLNEEFGIQNARQGMVAFLVTYAFGCELWAPWSEELGRWPIMQVSLGCVNLSVLLCALARSFPMVLTGRVLGGLSSAGGSVTLGMVADMFDPEDQQYAVLWASLWSCLGAVVGGICGGPIEEYLHWRWNFWIQLGFGCFVQVVHLFGAKETRATKMLDQEAKKRRKLGENIWGPNEVRSFKERFSIKEILQTMWRPYHMLMFEPIVLFLSLLSGFADALIFSFLESYGYIFTQWNFTKTQFGLAMIPLFISYWLAYFSFFPVVRSHNRRRKFGEVLSPETRLWWLTYIVWLLPIGLLGFAFVTGPPAPWISPLLFSILIGMANYAIYYATVDYMVAAYGEYSASATGGNGFARDFLAGMCALYTGPMYKRLGTSNSTFLLFGISVVVCVPVWIFWRFGEQIRKKSRFAQELAAEREIKAHKRENLVNRGLV
ncbi:MFS general substrate transporter [Corynespora cassiicola Philippines]|uniref:MFS general substrate transporter n=1 Tax=Corynespora cassiicola Philippines TaxID=1448308 RepID=A0A2T2NU31_CORCC|nr:MFS general substrate transporter [Corynespora cassiicola Philippines]